MTITQLTSDTAQAAMVGWQAMQPVRFRAAFSTVTTDNNTIHLGIFSDNHLLSVVTLQPRALGIYEVHVALDRKGAGVAHQLLPAFLSIRQQLFAELGVREVIGWVPRLHTGVRRLAERVGFSETGASLLQMVNGRLTEWQQLSLKVQHG